MLNRQRMKAWVPPLVLLLGVGVLGAVRESHIGGDIAWMPGYPVGREQARRTHKLMLLSFHTPGCEWCRKLDAETFTDPQVVELSRRLVCIRADSDTDTALVAKYQVLEYPTTLITDENGKTLVRISHYVSPEEFAPALRALLNHKP